MTKKLSTYCWNLKNNSKDNYYIFQPFNTDESIPIFYRNNGIDDK